MPDNHLDALTTIIKKNDMVGKLAVHRLHSHEPLGGGEIKLESKLETAPGKWMRPVLADSLDPADLHGLAFKIEHNGGGNAAFTLIPYEFAKGPSPIVKDDKRALACMAELANNIIQKDLVDVLALQFVEGDDAGTTAEVEVGGLGTITLPQSMQKIGTLVPVSWSSPVDPASQLPSPPPGQHWNESKKPDGTITHKVHVDNVDTEDGVLKSLADQGIVILAF
ncbi:hypothetical protein PG985_005573 [Apiospora marii]|uniref:uncharacterized protein n=1 Tax=Apiospora marii TaxID=335849 RepID=UPI003130A980